MGQATSSTRAAYKRECRQGVISANARP